MLIRKIRILAVTIVALALIGTGAAFAAVSRASAPKIGTGVVVVNTNLGFQDASAAGTGMVLTSSGRVLTNNHVIAGATTIRVRVPNTTRTYTAHVVGYDVPDDVALLQLQQASNLKTVTIGNSALQIGARVTAIGNAGGTGRLISARGRVIGLHKSITVQSDNGTPERLAGLIETNAAVEPGDSGGPLVNSAGKVVGMDTAAASFGVSDAYAIPIATATKIAKQIVTGKASTRVHIGATAFLGVQVQGTTIAGVVSGGPAEAAGLQPGDVITSIDGTPVTAAGDISSIVVAHKPGQVVTVVYTDATGVSRTATVTLASGPPQ